MDEFHDGFTGGAGDLSAALPVGCHGDVALVATGSSRERFSDQGGDPQARAICSVRHDAAARVSRPFLCSVCWLVADCSSPHRLEAISLGPRDGHRHGRRRPHGQVVRTAVGTRTPTALLSQPRNGDPALLGDVERRNATQAVPGRDSGVPATNSSLFSWTRPGNRRGDAFPRWSTIRWGANASDRAGREVRRRPQVAARWSRSLSDVS